MEISENSPIKSLADGLFAVLSRVLLDFVIDAFCSCLPVHIHFLLLFLVSSPTR